jgi:putative PEP-CTERM system histidine kinase
VIWITSFGLAAVAHVAFALLLLRGWQGRQAGLPLLAAAIGSAAWAGIGLLVALVPLPATLILLEAANGLRIALWLWLALTVLAISRGDVEHRAGCWRSPLQLTCVLVAASKLIVGLAWLALPEAELLLQANRVAGLALAVVGLMLVETIYKASDSTGRWATKHLLIGLGGIFAFDLFWYADALLVQRLSEFAIAGQALVSVLVIPLVAVAAARIRDFTLNIHVSRDLVVQSSALIASGVYLLAVAAAGLLIRELGLDWGPTLQLVFLFGAALLLFVLFSSGQLRAHGRQLVERSFFNFAYDYRKEWRRFVATMADGDAGRSLYERAIQAAADPLECSAGILYLRQRDDRFQQVTSWNWAVPSGHGSPPVELLERIPADRPLLEFATAASDDGVPNIWPTRPREGHALLVLQSRGHRVGALLLGRPRVSRTLTWEDHELFAILAEQIGSYIAEEQKTRALAEAQRFEHLTRNVSFVAHDLKNIVSQLSLHLQQAERHGNNPEFIRDTLLTVKESVDKMQGLLRRLKDNDGEVGETQDFDVVDLLADVARRKTRIGRPLEVDFEEPEAIVRASPPALGVVVENLIDNAYEAGADRLGMTVARPTPDSDEVVIEIGDNGAGMSRAFIDDHLFRPFVSTKPGGLGIGMYQCRALIERWGGRLDIDSRPGHGTTVRISLPSRGMPVENRLPQPAAE